MNTPEPCDSCCHYKYEVMHEDDPWSVAWCGYNLKPINKECSEWEDWEVMDLVNLLKQRMTRDEIEEGEMSYCTVEEIRKWYKDFPDRVWADVHIDVLLSELDKCEERVKLLDNENEARKINEKSLWKMKEEAEARVKELEDKLIHELAKNFQYEAEKATPGFLVKKLKQAEANLNRVYEAVERHRQDHEAYLSDHINEALYATVEEIRKEKK